MINGERGTWQIGDLGTCSPVLDTAQPPEFGDQGLQPALARLRLLRAHHPADPRLGDTRVGVREKGPSGQVGPELGFGLFVERCCACRCSCA